VARKRQARKCTAHCTDGRPCSSYAVTGAVVCAAHGGQAGQVKRAAARRLAEADALAVWQRFSTNGEGPAPVDVLRELNKLTTEVIAFKNWAGGQLAALAAGDTDAMDPRTAARVALWERSLDMAARVLADVAKLGLIERHIAAQHDAAETWILAHRRVGERVYGVIDRSLRAMNLTEDQWRIAREVITRELAALAPGD
jgi:hypothetical protein